VVFDAIRQLMAPKEVPGKKIGFQLRERRAVYGRGSSLRILRLGVRSTLWPLLFAMRSAPCSMHLRSIRLSERRFHAKPLRMQRRLEYNKGYVEGEYSRLFAVRAERAGRIK
jgi:hypothetical protein